MTRARSSAIPSRNRVADPMTLPGHEALVASWQALARLSAGAHVTQTRSLVTAVFPSWAPLNNAVLLHPPTDGTAATWAAEASSTYGRAGVSSWALWLPSRMTDLDAPDDLGHITGMVRDTTTLVMVGTPAAGLPPHPGVVRTSIATATRATEEPVSGAELPAPDGVPGLEGWVLVQDSAAVAGAWSCLHGDEYGIYAVGTVPEWRRRGLATALMQQMLVDARRRGARTATLQSTRMGEGLYASLGFVPVGRYEEWVPA